jgi:FkbM family methyltransferase
VIFDVGAGAGASTTEFSTSYPGSQVHAFEPASAAFSSLSENAKQLANVTSHQFALSDTDGVGMMTRNAKSGSNRLVSAEFKGEAEQVQIMTGDKFCADHGIGSVDYMKIEAEGMDLAVLVGFSAMLRERRFHLIQVQCSLSPENNRHAPLERLTNFLFPFGYRIYGFFGLARHLGGRIRRQGALYGDVVLIREDLTSSADATKELGFVAAEPAAYGKELN